MKPNTVIRPFHRDDTEAVVGLWSLCGLERPWNDPRTDIERKLGVQPNLFVVAEMGNRLIGTAMSGYDGHRGWVHYFAVHPDARGLGVGRDLIRNIEERLLDLGCPKVHLNVRGSNSSAASFWSAVGYQAADSLTFARRLIVDR